ncbi:putative bifunctional diguanylate cyclase/phosphodiesterase [Methylococcus capsulatus]|uniref:putative bifunctional diguanylate cyclase/phosphodiesterase n=1 Tax=Methylococcus capsulatus TaxID=414 RepID=UPI002FD9472E
MTLVRARDALCDSRIVVRVEADARPPRDRRSPAIYAVFHTDEPDGSRFLGLVTEHQIARFPQRIFADLIDPRVPPPVASDTPLEQLIHAVGERGQTLGMPLAVLERDGSFLGVLTPHSIVEVLLERERRLLEDARKINAEIRREADKAIEQLDIKAHYDTVTGLPNRQLFCDRLLQALAAHERDGNPVVLLFLDVDNFKSINDSLGHLVGDRLLRATAERIRTAVRDGDTVARIGGDEFTILLNGAKDTLNGALVAQKILDGLAQPFVFGAQQIVISVSIGIAVSPADGETMEQLLRNADTAMYHAKSRGKNNYQFFSPELNVQAYRRQEIERNLRCALLQGELGLSYAPRVDLRSGRIVALEVRPFWLSSELGDVPPDDFIPVAEETGLIVQIGIWAFRTACAHAAVWRTQGLADRCLSFRLSQRELDDPQFGDRIMSLLDGCGLEPENLQFELSERMLMTHAAHTLAVLQELSNRGIRFSVGDFGTGNASLRRLRRFPIDELKIDLSSVRDIEPDSDDAAVITAMIAMAKSLRMDVVAVGVETPEHVAFLLERGCRHGQGRLIGARLPPERIAALLAGDAVDLFVA